jgi:hypothetical protein
MADIMDSPETSKIVPRTGKGTTLPPTGIYTTGGVIAVSAPIMGMGTMFADILPDGIYGSLFAATRAFSMSSVICA